MDEEYKPARLRTRTPRAQMCLYIGDAHQRGTGRSVPCLQRCSYKKIASVYRKKLKSGQGRSSCWPKSCRVGPMRRNIKEIILAPAPAPALIQQRFHSWSMRHLKDKNPEKKAMLIQAEGILTLFIPHLASGSCLHQCAFLSGNNSGVLECVPGSRQPGEWGHAMAVLSPFCPPVKSSDAARLQPSDGARAPEEELTLLGHLGLRSSQCHQHSLLPASPFLPAGVKPLPCLVPG